MAHTIADALLLSLGVAISPIPIVVIFALLLSQRPRPTGLGFTGGWFAGIVVVIAAAIVFALTSEQLGLGVLQRSAAVVGVVLGALAIVAGVVIWFWRPARSATTQPGWLGALDRMSVAQAVAAGFGLSAVNPKNVLAGASAGLILGWSGLPRGTIVATAAAFSTLAASTVLVPMVAFLAVGPAITERLTAVRDWLSSHQRGVAALLLVAIGLLLVVRGLSGP